MNGFCLPSFLSCFRIYDIGLRAGLLTYYYIACLCIGCGTNKHRMQIDKKTMQLQLFIILLHYLMAFQSNDQGYLCSCNKKFSKAFKILLEVVIRDIYLSTGNFSFPKASFFLSVLHELDMQEVAQNLVPMASFSVGGQDSLRGWYARMINKYFSSFFYSETCLYIIETSLLLSSTVLYGTGKNKN